MAVRRILPEFFLVDDDPAKPLLRVRFETPPADGISYTEGEIPEEAIEFDVPIARLVRSPSTRVRETP